MLNALFYRGRSIAHNLKRYLTSLLLIHLLTAKHIPALFSCLSLKKKACSGVTLNDYLGNNCGQLQERWRDSTETCRNQDTIRLFTPRPVQGLQWRGDMIRHEYGYVII